MKHFSPAELAAEAAADRQADVDHIREAMGTGRVDPGEDYEPRDYMDEAELEADEAQRAERWKEHRAWRAANPI